MDTLADRLKRALALRGMTPAHLIAKSGISKAGVYFILDGTTKPDKIRADTLEKICKAVRVNRDWLLHGRVSRRQPRHSGRRELAV